VLQIELGSGHDIGTVVVSGCSTIHPLYGLDVANTGVIGHERTFENMFIGLGRMLPLYLPKEIDEDFGVLIDMRLTAWSSDNFVKSLVDLHDTKAVPTVACSIGSEDMTTARFPARNRCQQSGRYTKRFSAQHKGVLQREDPLQICLRHLMGCGDAGL
jgi:hypothetical protein